MNINDLWRCGCVKKFLFLLSSRAGRGKSIRYIRDIRHVFASCGMQDMLEVRLTEHENHVIELAREFSCEQGEKGVVYACGGDGSLGEAASAVLGTGCALGVIPLGTGNDFAKSVLPTLDAKKLFAATPNPQIRPIDIIALRMNAEEKPSAYCINVMSFGFDTLILAKTYALQEKFPFLGGMSYFGGVGVSLFSNKSFLTRVGFTREDGSVVEYEDDFILSALCNGGYYGNGFYPAPMAEVDDGVLHLLLAKSMSTAQILPLIIKYRKGIVAGDPRVRMESVVSGFFEGVNKPIIGNYDGTIFEAQRIDFEILPRSLPFAFLNV